MNFRKVPLVNGKYYHIYSRSIAKYIIFNNAEEYSRIMDIINLYRFSNFDYRYSKFLDLKLEMQALIRNDMVAQNEKSIEIIAYCIMPTHIHLILKQNIDNGISKYMAKVLNSYTRYFNIKHHRAGPLWVGHFKNVLIDNDDQLLHLTRYIHLNPTSANLVDKPDNWQFSSYPEYINPDNVLHGICNYDNLFNFDPKQYQKFVNDRKSYQKELSHIKNILIDEYTG